MVHGDVDVRTPQVPGECPLEPWRHPPIIGEHDDRARYPRRRCVAHIESRQLPCGAPQLGRRDIGSAGGAHDFTASYACGVSEQFAAANRCRERSDGSCRRQPAPDVPVVPARPRTAEYQTGKAGRLTLSGVYRGRRPERKANEDRLLRPYLLRCCTDRCPSTLPRKRDLAGGPVPGQVRRRHAIARSPKRFREWRPRHRSRRAQRMQQHERWSGG